MATFGAPSEKRKTHAVGGSARLLECARCFYRSIHFLLQDYTLLEVIFMFRLVWLGDTHRLLGVLLLMRVVFVGQEPTRRFQERQNALTVRYDLAVRTWHKRILTVD